MVEAMEMSKQSIGKLRIKKVLLISLPAVVAEQDTYLDKANVLHLGLAYIGSVIRESGYEVKILDCYAEDMFHKRESAENGYIELGLSDEQIIEFINNWIPDLIGISIPFSCQHYVAHKIARLIKRLFPNMTIVTGGNHVTAIPEKIDVDCFDYLIHGEGEYSFLQLLEELNNCNSTIQIPRIYPNSNSRLDFIDNLDDLPFPALDLLPLSKLWHGRRRWINMIATRGCVYNCVFCSIHTVMGHTIRRRSVVNVIAEILKWENAYHIQEIYFEDDNLTADKQWAKDLFRGIADLNLGIRFFVRNGIRADTIDRELLFLMLKAGFQYFMISPESGSQRTLDEIIGKKMKLEDCENAIKLAQGMGLCINTFFVLGFPDETWEDLKATVEYAKLLKVHGAAGTWLSTATPYPGTRLYHECIGRGLIDPNHLDYRKLRTSDYVINHPIFSREELLTFRKQAMEDLLPPRLSIQKINKVITLLRTDPSLIYQKLRYKLGF
jgi:anaerobic magnesium-protoporphyrin IX monomethyl ester cyclase